MICIKLRRNFIILLTFSLSAITGYGQLEIVQSGNDIVGESPYLGTGIPVFPARLSISNDGNIVAAASAHASKGTGTSMNYVKVYQNNSQIGQTLSYAEDGVDLTCTTSYGHGLLSLIHI